MGQLKFAAASMAACCFLTCGAAAADGGPDASRASAGARVELAEFSGADRLFDRGWQFRFGDDAGWAAKDCDDSRWRHVDLPHDFLFELPWSEKSKASLGFKPLGTAWYRKHFKVEPSWKGKRVFAEFEAIMAVGDVWLNGEKIGSTEYGCLGAVCELTDKLDWDGDNVLAVRADGGREGGSRWYTGGGLTRDVHLFAKSRISAARNGFYIRSSVAGDEATVDALVQLDGYAGLGNANRLEIILEIFEPSGKRVAREAAVAPWSKKAHQEVALPPAKITSPLLWDVDSPNLYTATATLRLNGTVIDRVKERFGIRTIEFGCGFGFKLNGRKVFLQGMANHENYGALGAAVFDRAIRRRFALMKEFGFNAVRCSHNPYSKSFLSIADEMGILVVDEFIDKWGDESCWNGRLPLSYIWHGLVTEWVKRDRNHPSVIMWSLGNELQHRENACGLPTDDWGVTTYRLFDTMAKRWDSTRPTTVAMFPAREDSVTRSDPGFNDDPRPPELSRITDVASFNYMYEDYPAYKRHAPELNIFQSEASVHALQRPYVAMDREHTVGLCWWGAIAYWGESDKWPKKGWNYSLFDRTLDPFPTAFLVKSFLVGSPMAEIAVVPPSSGGDEAVVWNDIKVGRMNAVSDWTFETGSVLGVVYVYTNAEEAELFVNGKSLGVRKNNDTDPKTAHALRWTNVKYEPGKIEAVARTGGEIVARRALETAGRPVRLELLPENPGDWKADGQDLQFVRVMAVDAKGRRVRAFRESVRFTVAGAASLVAVDDGDHETPLLFRGVDAKPMRDGSLLAILRANTLPGPVALLASSQSLPDASLELSTAR